MNVSDFRVAEFEALQKMLQMTVEEMNALFVGSRLSARSSHLMLINAKMMLHAIEYFNKCNMLELYFGKL